ncbi:hypothetical protein Tco_0919176, partial [Tanacetum coccineum]
MSPSSSSIPQPHHIHPTTIVTTTSSTPPPPLQQRPTRVRWFNNGTTKMAWLVLMKTTNRVRVVCYNTEKGAFAWVWLWDSQGGCRVVGLQP